ncbi:uncharacterized protein LOC133814922 [Humulus lupulus]|uniref:uncharacterized protein LOC133814922 n=1 Tax=Humulus lupulus TaxID=3486 RepID=UPI002B407E23|nr:uncharacterized protein LOC133814922 [Humulus lupulus]
MPSREAFDLYNNINVEAPASRKRGSRRHRGESSSDPSKKRARTKDPPAPPSFKDTTPPPAPLNPTPPAPLHSNPLAPRNPSPPNQSGKTQAEAILNTAYNLANDKLKKLSRHRRSQEAFRNVSSMKIYQIFSHALNEVLIGVMTMNIGWCPLEEIVAKHAEEIKTVKERLVEQLKVVEVRHAEQLKVVEAKHAEQLRAAEEKAAKLGKKLKQHQEALVKITEAKEKYKEASVLNFKEASKLQNDLEKQPRGKLCYLPEHMKQAMLENCTAHLEEERKAQESPEISLATGIEGVEEDDGTTVDQQPQQDSPAAPAAQ